MPHSRAFLFRGLLIYATSLCCRVWILGETVSCVRVWWCAGSGTFHFLCLICHAFVRWWGRPYSWRTARHHSYPLLPLPRLFPHFHLKFSPSFSSFFARVSFITAIISGWAGWARCSRKGRLIWSWAHTCINCRTFIARWARKRRFRASNLYV